MLLHFRRASLVVLLLVVTNVVAHADNWPAWRGARYDGICRETSVPVKFSKTENLAWKLDLPKRAGSTPIVWNDRIFLTTPDADDSALLLVCVSTSGDILWKRELGKGNRNARDTEAIRLRIRSSSQTQLR